jgi:hypothetical protein
MLVKNMSVNENERHMFRAISFVNCHLVNRSLPTAFRAIEIVSNIPTDMIGYKCDLRKIVMSLI